MGALVEKTQRAVNNRGLVTNAIEAEAQLQAKFKLPEEQHKLKDLQNECEDLKESLRQLDLEAHAATAMVSGRRLATEPALAADATISPLWAPLVFILCFLAYMVWRRFSAPPRPKDHGTYVKHGSHLVPVHVWRQAHEDSDPYDNVIV